MNKKIKIIDLFNKIANGEEPPKKIKKEELEGNSFEDLIDNLKYFNKDFSKTLNDYVEILEDNTEEQENLGESWKEVGKRVGEWAKEFEQGFKESFTEIVRYPFEKLEDNTEEIEELDTDIHIDSFMDAELNFNKIAQEINKLGKAIRELRKEKE